MYAGTGGRVAGVVVAGGSWGREAGRLVCWGTREGGREGGSVCGRVVVGGIVQYNTVQYSTVW